MKITVQTYFISIEALLGKCDLPSEDDNDFREKGEEFLISTVTKNQWNVLNICYTSNCSEA